MVRTFITSVFYNIQFFFSVTMYFFTSRTFTTMYFSAMSEMFPDLTEPLPPTVSPTPHTWNKVDQDIQQHTYNIHYDMITKLQNEVKELSTKVLQNQEDIKLLQMTQRTHHTTTTNNYSIFCTYPTYVHTLANINS